MQQPSIPEYITIDETDRPIKISVQLTGNNAEDKKRLALVSQLKSQIRGAVQTEWIQPVERETGEMPVVQAPTKNNVIDFPTGGRQAFTEWTQQVTATLPKEYRVAAPRTSLRRVCPTCRCEIDNFTHGFTRDSQSEKAIPCPMCSPAVKRNVNKRNIQPHINKLVEQFKFHDANNLPRDASLYTLEEYPGDTQARVLVEQFIDEKMTELMLIGPQGRGKSVLSMLAVSAMAARGMQALFLPMVDYLSLLKENFSTKDSNHIKEISQCVEVLVIDDLARTSGSQFAIDEFGEMIDRRHAQGLRTLITTNYTLTGLAQRWQTEEGKVTGVQPVEPIISRLRGWYTVYEMSGPDLRIQ